MATAPDTPPADATDGSADDGGTRWLDVEEQRAWRSYLRAVRLLDEEMRRGLERHGLSHPEYEILVRLSESPERKARMSELASSVVSSRSRLTHTVARLQQAGLVDRRARAGDPRGGRPHPAARRHEPRRVPGPRSQPRQGG